VLDFDRQGSLLQLAGKTNFDILPYIDIANIKNLPYDYIFIDTPPYLMENLESLCSVANLILIPTRAGVLDLFAIEKTIKVIKASKNGDKTMIVFNMVKSNTTLTEEIHEKIKEFNIQVANTMLGDYVDISRSVILPLTEDRKAKQQLDELSYEVLTALHNNK